MVGGNDRDSHRGAYQIPLKVSMGFWASDKPYIARSCLPPALVVYLKSATSQEYGKKVPEPQHFGLFDQLCVARRRGSGPSKPLNLAITVYATCRSTSGIRASKTPKLGAREETRKKDVYPSLELETRPSKDVYPSLQAIEETKQRRIKNSRTRTGCHEAFQKALRRFCGGHFTMSTSSMHGITLHYISP